MLRGGQDSLSAYLVNMAIRLNEMKRVMKSTGTIYLHCDPKASHYLKVLMDAVFDSKRFLNEISWKEKWHSFLYKPLIAGSPRCYFGLHEDANPYV